MNLKLDADGDLMIENGNLVLVDGIDEIRQNLKTRISTFLGEWFLDNRIGLPWIQRILQKNPDPTIIDSVFKSTIVNTPGVIELLKFRAELDDSARTINLSFRARTVDGIINYSEVFS